jgi:hypothetical protein
MDNFFFIVLVLGLSTNAANYASLKEKGSVHLEGKHVAKFKLESFLSRLSPRLFLRCCGSERVILRGGGGKTSDSKGDNELKRKHISGTDESDSGDETDDSDSNIMTGTDSQDLDEQGGESKGDKRKSPVSSAEVLASNKDFDRRLDAYARRYGLSTGQPANPLGMLLEKAARSMDAKTRFKIKKENFALQAKEMDAIKRQLKEDDARRPCRCELPPDTGAILLRSAIPKPRRCGGGSCGDRWGARLHRAGSGRLVRVGVGRDPVAAARCVFVQRHRIRTRRW